MPVMADSSPHDDVQVTGWWDLPESVRQEAIAAEQARRYEPVPGRGVLAYRTVTLPAAPPDTLFSTPTTPEGTS